MGEARHSGAALRVLGAAVCAAVWLALACWRLPQVPGLTMDEAWSILAARGLSAPADPLSGMTRYAGPFPVWLLQFAGPEAGWLVLRGASIACNFAAIVLLARILARLAAGRRLEIWALPLIASLPIWFVFMREGIEIAMFGPLLAILGLELVMRENRVPVFAGGVVWGVATYNHLLGAFGPLSLALAFALVHRRLPRLPLGWLAGGFAIGLAPRVAALALYGDRPLEGGAALYEFEPALRDLAATPHVLWSSLCGDALYLRAVGRVAMPVLPYWLLVIGLLVPFRGKLRELPRPALVTLLAALLLAVMGTVGTPRLAVRYMVLPAIAIAAFAAQLGQAAIEARPEAARFVRGIAAVLVAGNLLYAIGNFYLPWAADELAISRFALGDRNRQESNAPFLPKDGLVRALRERAPAQVITVPSLERPLRVLLADTPIRVAHTKAADPALPSVYASYFEGRPSRKKCIKTPVRRCFRHPEPLATHFVVWGD